MRTTMLMCVIWSSKNVPKSLRKHTFFCSIMSQKADKKGRVGREEEEEDYGDYTTRCICGYVHDDGFMVQCDGCSVWQHVECITVNPNNLPDKYLCEVCHPRPVDRKRARQLQQKKKEDISGEFEDSSPRDSRSDLRKPPSHPSVPKRRRKQSKDGETKPSLETKKTKKEKVEGRKGFRKGSGGGKGVGGGGGGGKMGSIQCLLNAATLLDEEKEGGRAVGSASSWKELWCADNSPWCDKYDTAEHSRLSEAVRNFVTSHHNQLKSEAVVFGQQEYSSMENHTHPQCSVTEVQRRRMGVVAQNEVPEDELVLEYKGKVSVLSAVLADYPPETRSLWKQKPCPFVYIYDKISDLDICIDARQYGNLARFIRRSCAPNSELRHFFVGSELHFGVYATHTISVHEEITLPFDFTVEKCDYPMECGCGRKNCWVVRASRGRGRGREGGVRGEEGEKENGVKVSSKPPPPPLVAPPPHDEDSNSSWTSSSGTRRKQRGHAHHTQTTSNLIGRLSSVGGGEGGSHEGSSDSEEESGERKIKVKSREERKAEAVMKVFQRMEASSQRKRRHLTSEGSADSDTLSPSPFHPLTPSQRVAVATQRERRGSTGSVCRPPILPPAKMRLSSVSSNEGVSTTDLPDAFSPPVTPRLAPLASPHPLSSPLPSSPLHTPTYLQSPTVRFTPDLHPKYLLMQFPLPLKKALLRQWEAQKHGNHGDNGRPRPLWPRGEETSQSNGYYSPVWSSGDVLRPRPRGSLKHRWLRRYSEEKAENEEKENRAYNSTSAVHLKQRLLRRWQKRETSISHQPTDPVTNSTNTSSTLLPSPTVDSGVALPTQQERRQSPLFEEFSDSEFDAGREKEEEEEEQAVEEEEGQVLSDNQPGEIGGSVPDSQTPSIVGDVTMPGSKEGVSDRVVVNDVISTDVGVGQRDGEGSVVKSESVEKTEIVRKTRSLEELMSEEMGSVGRGEGEEGEGVRRSGGKSLEELMVMDMAISGGGDGGGEGGVRRGGEGEGVMFASTDPREAAGQQLSMTKTPVKRKINLSEYRSRVRKPPSTEPRRDSSSSDLPPPPTASSSFLPPSFTPSHLTPSSYSLLPTPPGGAALLSEALPLPPPPPPHFEPVSPDECEPTTPILTPGSAHSRGPVGVMPGHIPLGVLPGVATPPLPPPAPPTFISPGSHTPTPYGIEPMWTAPQLEPSQDPRRHVMGGASHAGLLPHPQPHLPPPPPHLPGAPPHMMMSQPPHSYAPSVRRPPLFHPRPPGPGGSGGGIY